jgi:hypothetical protein
VKFKITVPTQLFYSGEKSLEDLNNFAKVLQITYGRTEPGVQISWT